MGTMSIWHWLVVMVIVMVVFGTKKLRSVGADLGGAIKGFRDGMAEVAAEHGAGQASRDTARQSIEARVRQ